jgi:hypothetical protein
MAQGDHQRGVRNLTGLYLEVGAASTLLALSVRSNPGMCASWETDRFPSFISQETTNAPKAHHHYSTTDRPERLPVSLHLQDLTMPSMTFVSPSGLCQSLPRLLLCRPCE